MKFYDYVIERPSPDGNGWVTVYGGISAKSERDARFLISKKYGFRAIRFISIQER